MSPVAQNNASFEELVELLLRSDDIAICGHTSPDGDCIGSTLALGRLLRALGKNVHTLFADKDYSDSQLAFLPCYDQLMFAGKFKGSPKLFISVDVPNDMRMGKYAADVKRRSAVTLGIDHHELDKCDFDHRYINPASASCTLIIWRIYKELLDVVGDEALDPDVAKDVATCCYAGLLTDTGRFMFQNTDAGCFEGAKEMVDAGIDMARISNQLFQEQSYASIRLNALAANRMELLNGDRVVISWLSQADLDELGAENSDTEGCINTIRSLRGTQVACMLKERGDTVRGSLRSKDGTDVASIANEFGGGGHKVAAGFTLKCDLDEAIDKVVKRLGSIDFNGPDKVE